MNFALFGDGDEESRLSALIQELLKSLPDGTAHVAVKDDPSGTIFYLTPTNPRCAAFGVHYDGCVDVFFGKYGTTFELPHESGLPKDADFESILQWVKDMGVAVIAGKCKERAGFWGIRGTVWVRGKEYGITNFFHIRFYPKTLHYLPYS